MKYTKFGDIPQFVKSACYQINVDIRRVPEWIKEQEQDGNLKLNPDFQRGHVWTEEQQIAWLEFFLRGGKSGKDIYFNDPFWLNWGSDVPGMYKDFVCVDGLQRLTAVQRFVNNEIKVFESYFNEFEDPRILNTNCLVFHVNDLKTEKEVLQWYIDMNIGGTPHSQEEIDRVKKMLKECE